MNMNKETIETRILPLTEETIAQFGIMGPQHMVEHLAITLKISYDRIKLPDFEPSEKQINQKIALIHSDIEFPKGIKAPGLHEDLMPLKFPDLEKAKEDFLKSITAYNDFFLLNPEAKTTHPRFGKLTHGEWERFHEKHFKHHLIQFGL
jgi:oxepin-CoA hydrolase/3-oxo-5,6-dehydrosuberyl-CoA semialdehyde dehydrogenase